MRFVREAVLACVIACPTISAAQTIPSTRPTPEQARALLESRPDVVQQLRERMQQMGLTPQQTRARLRAEGYPEDLFDAYLPGSRS
ncbi:MAG: hypothetical protein ABI120_03650, partial [Gemmatimonadaceae bacterium]